MMLRLMVLSATLPGCLYASGFFCNKTNQYVYTGDNLNTVLQRCGVPDQTKQIPSTTSTTTTPGQRWIYDYQAKQYTGQAAPIVTPGQPLLTIYFNQTQVTDIYVNGHAKSSTTFCGNSPPLKIRMSYLQARSICGVPNQILNIQLPQKKRTPTKIQWIYNNGNALSPTTLTFDHSTLIEISS